MDEKILNAIEEQNKLLRQILETQRQQLAFWNQITSEDYFNEMIKKEGIPLPR